MSNSFFNAVLKETDPMFDAAIISENGVEYRHNPCSNPINNGYSTAKLFYATAVGVCCDLGLLSLETKVTSLFDSEELPQEIDPNWHEVTVYDVLRHKIGFETLPCDVCDNEAFEIFGDDFLKYIFSLKLPHKRDTFRRYSDAAYYLAGRIIHKVSGMTADDFLEEKVLKPLAFGHWASTHCRMGHPICGDYLFSTALDSAKLGFTYACGGVYNGKQIISQEWIDMAMCNDFACSQFRDTGIFLKTGAHGQMIAFSPKHKVAVAWHGYSLDGNARNDRLLEAFADYLN